MQAGRQVRPVAPRRISQTAGTNPVVVCNFLSTPKPYSSSFFGFSDLAFSALALHAGHWQPAGHLPAFSPLAPCMKGHSPLPSLQNGHAPPFFMCSATFSATLSATVQTSAAGASQRTRSVLSLQLPAGH